MGKKTVVRNILHLNLCILSVFVMQEDNYEWGSSSILDALPSITSQQRRLAVAAMRWRKALQRSRSEHEVPAKIPITVICLYSAKFSVSQGAFSGWTVMLNIDHSRESGFRRLLQSGGAKVTAIYSELLK